MLSKSCKYAIRAVLYLAISADEGNKMKAEEIAEKLDIPKHFLAKILQPLAKRGIISSTKGRQGGFYLNEVNKSNKLLTIIEYFDGKDVFINCILGLNHCSNEMPCPYHNWVDPCRTLLYSKIQSETIGTSAKRIDEFGFMLSS